MSEVPVMGIFDELGPEALASQYAEIFGSSLNAMVAEVIDFTAKFWEKLRAIAPVARKSSGERRATKRRARSGNGEFRTMDSRAGGMKPKSFMADCWN